MFGYLYANSAGIRCFISAKTREILDEQILNNLKTMVDSRFVNSDEDKQKTSIIYDAIKLKNVDKAMKAWNDYEGDVSCHKIEEIKFIE